MDTTHSADILSAEDVAQLLRCDGTTIEEHARKGELPGVKIGRSWIFPRVALIEAINNLARDQAASRRSGRGATPQAVAKSAPASKTRKTPPALPSLSAA